MISEAAGYCNQIIKDLEAGISELEIHKKIAKDETLPVTMRLVTETQQINNFIEMLEMKVASVQKTNGGGDISRDGSRKIQRFEIATLVGNARVAIEDAAESMM